MCVFVCLEGMAQSHLPAQNFFVTSKINICTNWAHTQTGWICGTAPSAAIGSFRFWALEHILRDFLWVDTFEWWVTRTEIGGVSLGLSSCLSLCGNVFLPCFVPRCLWTASIWSDEEWCIHRSKMHSHSETYVLPVKVTACTVLLGNVVGIGNRVSNSKRETLWEGRTYSGLH